MRSEILINVVDPSPDTKLSSEVEVPPPPHAVNANASTINVANFFITSSLAISDEQALNMKDLRSFPRCQSEHL